MVAANPVINLPEPLRLDVTGTSDVASATEATRAFALAIGFNELQREQLSIVAAELASNLVRHAGGGTLKLTALANTERRGLQIESEDKGPGITDVELALTDGYSTAGGLGTGLGSVNRFMDELEFHQLQPSGLRILSQRWIRPSTQSLSQRRLECGAATRACQRAPENGDAIVVQQWEDNALVGVIDGVGHGQLAQKASQAARQYVEQHFDQPLQKLFLGVNRTCRATRGVVMALGKFDLRRGTLSVGSVGNVETRLLQTSAHVHLVSRRGILGLNAPEPLVTESTWHENNLLVMHSDGVQSRWNWDDFKASASLSPGLIARRLLKELGTLEDDATVLVVKNAARA